MKKYAYSLVFISGIIPILWIVRSFSLFDLSLYILIIYIFINKKIKIKNFFLLLLFLIILTVINTISLIFNFLNTIDIDIFLQSMIYIIRLTEMVLFLYILRYINKYKSEVIQESVYLSLNIIFIFSVIYTIFAFFNIVVDEKAISIQGRVSSFFGNANGYGYFLLYIFVTNLFFTKNTILRYILLFFIMLCIFTTGSFSSILLLILIITFQFKYRYIFKYVLILVILYLVLFFSFEIYAEFLPDRILNIISMGTISSVGTYSTRSEHIEMAIEMIINNINYFTFLGLGLGNSNIFIDDNSLVSPHNTFINLVLMIGLVPTVILILIFIIFLLQLYKLSNNKKIFITYMIPFLGYFTFSPIAYLPEVYIPLIMIYKKIIVKK